MTNEIDRHIPAFPFTTSMTVHHKGMTLRDYFAALAMQAEIMADNSQRMDKIADYAYAQADHMMERRTR